MQRLRRISQLGVSNLTYPGATHTRFAHSLGVAWIFHRMAEHLNRLGNDTRLDVYERQVGTYAALLHDLGHLPFSHALEQTLGVMKHEARTCAVIEEDATEVHQVLASLNPSLPKDVADVIRGTSDMRRVVGMLSSQLDADRMDYLLRDSLYAGVEYGHYDLDRLLYSMIGFDEDNTIILSRKAIPLAEQYVIARYHMYWQVYFHKTTRCAELLLIKAIQCALQNGALPSTLNTLIADDDLESFTRIDEADVVGALKHWSEDKAHADLSCLARRFLDRRLFKCACTAGVWGEMDERKFERLVRSGDLERAVDESGFDPNWFLIVDRPADQAYDSYYISPAHEESAKPPIVIEDRSKGSVPLETVSDIVDELSKRQVRGVVYVPNACLPAIRALVER